MVGRPYVLTVKMMSKLLYLALSVDVTFIMAVAKSDHRRLLGGRWYFVLDNSQPTQTGSCPRTG